MTAHTEALSQLLKSTVPVAHEPSLTALLSYAEILFNWHKKTNLVAANTLDGIISEHIIDSIYLFKKLILDSNFKQAKNIIDVGSGAGLPGIVLAILQPETNLYLIEPRTKATSFLKEVRRRLKLLNVEIQETKIENLKIDLTTNDTMLISRAFSPMDELINSCSQLIKNGSSLFVATGENSQLLTEQYDLKGFVLTNIGGYHPDQPAKLLAVIRK